VGGACSTHIGDEKFIRNLVGKPEGTRPLVKLEKRYEDNIKIHLIK
jgi:hypothetical protein